MAYIAYEVPCYNCGRVRVVHGHPSQLERAKHNRCGRCRDRRSFALSLTMPFAKQWQPDETVDWVVVDRLVGGQPVVSTHAERVAAVAVLTAQGVPASTIADRMHLAQRSVERLRSVIRRTVAA